MCRKVPAVLTQLYGMFSVAILGDSHHTELCLGPQEQGEEGGPVVGSCVLGVIMTAQCVACERDVQCGPLR